MAGLLWPFIIFAALKTGRQDLILPAVALLMLMRALICIKNNGFADKSPIIGSLFAMALCALSLALDSVVLLFYYPLIVTLSFFGLFFSSLFGNQTAVARLAALTKKEPLTPAEISYTRKVTQAWCLFFVLNGAISFYTIQKGSLELWTLYNGLISYILMGLMFGGEFVIRKKAISRAEASTAAQSKLAGAQEQQGSIVTADLLHPAPVAAPILPFSCWLTGPGDDLVFACQNAGVTRAQLRAWVMDLKGRIENSQKETVYVMVQNQALHIAVLCACCLCKVNTVFPGHRHPGLLSSGDPACALIITDDLKAREEGEKLSFAALYENANEDRLSNLICISDEMAEDTLKLDDDFGVYLYTSGSTGEPKRIEKKMRYMNLEAELLSSFIRKDLEGSILTSSVYPYHMYGFTFSICLPMCLKIALYPRLIHYSEELCALCFDKIAFITSPAFITRLDFALKPPALCFASSAGGPLKLEFRIKFRQWCALTLFDIYGSTESGVVGVRCGEGLNNSAPLTALDKVSIEGNDQDGYTLHSPLAAGGVLKLDDKIEIQDERHFRLKGRVDRIVKIEEKRVSLDAVEQKVKECCACTQCRALPVLKGERMLLGLVVAPSDPKVAEDPLLQKEFVRALRLLLSKNCDQSATPRLIRVVPALPCNAMGKIDTPALKQILQGAGGEHAA